MDTTHLHLMLSFGHCSKAESDIGRYGNGFKSGSMRVGRDALVFTRTQQPAVITVGLLSQTFLADIHADEVLVPIVSWNADTFRMSIYIIFCLLVCFYCLFIIYCRTANELSARTQVLHQPGDHPETLSLQHNCPALRHVR